jgi:hypothetical protein
MNLLYILMGRILKKKPNKMYFMDFWQIFEFIRILEKLLEFESKLEIET